MSTEMTVTARRLLLAIAIFALLGIAVSSLSLDHHFRKSKTSYCDFGQTFNCDIVNRSEYSTVAGVPVALIGILGYVTVLAFATFYREKAETPGILLASSVAGLACSLPHLRREIHSRSMVHSLPHIFVRNFHDCSLVVYFVSPLREPCAARLAADPAKQPMENSSQQVVMAKPVGANSTVVGDLRIHEFNSHLFRNRRNLRVWVPPGYDLPENSGRRYPVFYLNDGQNLFDSETSFTKVEWQVDETADRLIRTGVIPPTIFVGIDNVGGERLKEYLPYRSLNPVVLRPQGARYSAFLTKEIMPFVSQNYRTAKGAENTLLGGSSLGGLIALYVAMTTPGVFGSVLIESPSLWVRTDRYCTMRASHAYGRTRYSGHRHARSWPRRERPPDG